MLDFEIDKLTNSIENAVTGDIFQTDVIAVSMTDIRLASKRNGWLFSWSTEYKQPACDVFKLSIVNNSAVLQGLMSVEVKADHVYLHLIESAPFNVGKGKMYVGVLGNLVAYACKLSFQRGHEGYVTFVAKTRLVDHYITVLGAKLISRNQVIIDTPAALRLVNRYFSK